MDINRDNYESWFLDYIEGSLSAGQISQVHQFIAVYPDLARELAVWQQTLLKPDMTVVFQQKETLKKRRTILPSGWVYTLGAVAAAVLLFALCLPLLRPSTETHGRQARQQQLQRLREQSSEQSASPGIPVNPSDFSLPPAPSESPAAIPQAAPESREAEREAEREAQREAEVLAPVATTIPNPGRAHLPNPGRAHLPNPAPAPMEDHIRGSRMTPAGSLALTDPEHPSVERVLPIGYKAAAPVSEPEKADQLALAGIKQIPEQSGLQNPSWASDKPILDAINDRLPVDIGQVLSRSQSAANSLAGYMSGETALLGNRNRDQEETRVFQFSLGSFKIYHRKTPKSTS